MPLSTAERNRRKRERKKREKEAARKEAQQNSTQPENETENENEIEIEYVAEPISFPSAETATKEAEESGNSNVAGLPPGVGNSNETNENNQDGESIDQVLRRFQERAALISDDDAAAQEQPEGGHPAGASDSDEDDSDDDDRKPMSKRKLRDLTRPSVAELKRRWVFFFLLLW